ncbi:MAG: GDSL-type esterase/lipase family protein [Bacteroidales bacterium]|nr:GDSL-type esterase/lipase family protein [Bacteroidales bacterium]
MKSYKILLFIVIIIAVLAIMCATFPTTGITIGKTTLRFPSLAMMLNRNDSTRQSVDESFQAISDSMAQEMQSLKDTLGYYHNIVETHPARFYCPDAAFDFFDTLFEKMATAKTNKKVVRVLHYGDSQIEMDRISTNLRSWFQNIFGGGGPGLLPLVQAIPTFSVNQSYSGDYGSYVCYGEGERSDIGDYGIMAKSFYIHGNGYFSATSSRHSLADEKVKKFSRVQLLLNNHDSTFEAELNDSKHGYQQTVVTEESGVQLLRWMLDATTTAIHLSMQGDATIYGVLLDNGYGVAVDNIPLRGSSGTIFTQLNKNLVRTAYLLSDVELIIMQFGGNSVPNIGSDANIASFKESMVKQIQRVQKIYPEAKILFIGPADMSTRKDGVLQTYPFLPKTIQALKEAALENGAAFWNMYEVMGGKNSMITWEKNGLAGNDYIHFTNAGAEKIGKALASTFSSYYQFYLLRQNIEKQQFDSLWNGSFAH